MRRPGPCEPQTPEPHPVLLPGDPEARNSERELIGAAGDDAESLARLQKTVTALAPEFP
jgi:hypothetical protein